VDGRREEEIARLEEDKRTVRTENSERNGNTQIQLASLTEQKFGTGTVEIADRKKGSVDELERKAADLKKDFGES